MTRGLPRELGWRIKQMYEERDGKGNRVWSLMRLAAHFAVSETTVFRIVNSYGRYGRQPLPEVRGADQLELDAKASLERFMRQHADLMPPASAAEKMAHAATELLRKEKAGDTMLGELKGDQDDGRKEG